MRPDATARPLFRCTTPKLPMLLMHLCKGVQWAAERNRERRRQPTVSNLSWNCCKSCESVSMIGLVMSALTSLGRDGPLKATLASALHHALGGQAVTCARIGLLH